MEARFLGIFRADGFERDATQGSDTVALADLDAFALPRAYRRGDGTLPNAVVEAGLEQHGLMLHYRDTMDHFAEFLRTPREIGTVTPSSKSLVTAMVDWIEWDRIEVAVEYGPGKGAITGGILQRLRRPATFFAVERNASLAASFRKKFPDVTLYENSVVNIAAICNEHGVSKIDSVISSLPWATFSEEQQDLYLDEMLKKMSPGAQFVSFAYLVGLPFASGRRFRRRLEDHFSSVETSDIVWKNFPPAVVYRCRK